jgi:hypothetical protein
MEKFEQREPKRGTGKGRIWRSLSKENRRGVQDKQNMEKFEQKRIEEGTGQAEHKEV